MRFHGGGTCFFILCFGIFLFALGLLDGIAFKLKYLDFGLIAMGLVLIRAGTHPKLKALEKEMKAKKNSDPG